MLFPMFLKLEGRRVVVVGGGNVAESKVESVLAVGAQVTLVAPRAKRSIADRVRRLELRWIHRQFEPRDLDGAFLVIAATGTSEVDRLVVEHARQHGILCNAVDDAEFCDFYFPAVIRRGDLQIAVSTSGQSPALAQQLRRILEQQFPSDYGRTVRRLGKERRLILATVPPGAARKQLLHRRAKKCLRAAASRRSARA